MRRARKVIGILLNEIVCGVLHVETLGGFIRVGI